NTTVAVTGEEGFFIPDFGVRLERLTDESSTYAGVKVEWNIPDIAATASSPRLDSLGRLNADRDFVTIQWNAEHSFFLEPIFDHAHSGKAESTRAHEVSFRAHGQVALNDARLVPSLEMIAGGADTVRGYPESVVAGDTVVVATAEYRLHVPRLLAPY